MTSFFTALLFLAALGSGIVGGVFYAFSTFVMRALARLPAADGMAAMQGINVAVINPLFLGVFLGTGLLCLAVGIGGALHWDRPGAAWILAGALLYLVGTLAVTMMCNVPMNDALAKLAAADPAAVAGWNQYIARWTFWNHVRTVAAILATAMFVWSLRCSAD